MWLHRYFSQYIVIIYYWLFIYLLIFYHCVTSSPQLATWHVVASWRDRAHPSLDPATFLPQVSFTREIWVVGSLNWHIYQVYSLWELPPSYIKYHSLWRYEELGSATRHICQARIWHTYVSSKRKLPGSREICGVFQVSMSRIFKWELPPSYGHIMGAIETFFSCWKPWTPI